MFILMMNWPKYLIYSLIATKNMFHLRKFCVIFTAYFAHIMFVQL